MFVKFSVHIRMALAFWIECNYHEVHFLQSASFYWTFFSQLSRLFSFFSTSIAHKFHPTTTTFFCITIYIDDLASGKKSKKKLINLITKKKKKNALIEFSRIFWWLFTFFDIFVNNDKDIVNLERCVTLKKKNKSSLLKRLAVRKGENYRWLSFLRTCHNRQSILFIVIAVKL